MGLFRQAAVLTQKDLKIVLIRRWCSTILRAAILPVAYIIFIAYVRDFFLPPSRYGIGEPRPTRNLTTEVFNSSTSLGGRDRIAFINNGFTGGPIGTLMDRLSGSLTAVGADVRILTDEEDLLEVCQSSLSGFSRCYAAASFHSSPTEGRQGIWSYTARVDGGLGISVFVDQADNDAQVYVLPFVHAIVSEIARLSNTSLPAPENMLEYPFTYETIQDREDTIQRFFMRALSNYLAVTLFIAACGITYHLPGYVATEREIGMSKLIDSMSYNYGIWTTLMARLASTYMSFSIIYIPGWLAIGAVVSTLIFTHTAAAIVVPFHLLLGFSLTGYSAFAASFFRRAQLSGITVLIVSLVSAIVVQFAPRTATVVGVLSALFPPATYTAFAIQLAQWERHLVGASLRTAPPRSNPDLPGCVFFALLAAQIIVYPLLAALVQYLLHSTSRDIHRIDGQTNSPIALKLVNVSKTFCNSWWQRTPFRRAEIVYAVSDLNLSFNHGHLISLLGVNGSGKSTTMAGIAGTQAFSSGTIEAHDDMRVGLCPQTNVAWDDLTVFEHVAIFDKLKSKGPMQSKERLVDLVAACDLSEKLRAKPNTLSGGQKRKLQLAMAFAGGSTICCIDEASSGLDPLSRRKIWEILLAERGKRMIILTTHALDEADALSDDIAIMSQGRLVAQGSSAELKEKYGGGYRVATPHSKPALANINRTVFIRESNENVQQVASSSDACRLVAEIEKQYGTECSIRGPSIEDVFLNIALAEQDRKQLFESASLESEPYRIGEGLGDGTNGTLAEELSAEPKKQSISIVKGTGTNFWQQVWILWRKRVLVWRRNWMPYVAALLVPVLTAGLAGNFFLAGFGGLQCSLGDNANNPRRLTLGALERYWGILVPVGPASDFIVSDLPAAYAPFRNQLPLVNTFDDFQAYVRDNFRDVVPGGFYLGDNPASLPLMAYRVNGNLGYSALAKNLADSYLMNTTINADFSTFALPFSGSTGDSLQLILYICFAMCAYPGFFALYSTFERLGNVRALHYSSGVRPAPLWLAYWLFDAITVIMVSVVVTAVFAALSDVWFALGYLFVVLLLYGLCSTLLAHIVSLFSKTQLAAFAVFAALQAVSLLLYFIMYMLLLTFGSAEQLQKNLDAVQYTYGLISPSGTLLRAMLLTLNQSQILCRERSYVAYPGDITVYGAPILYLVLQSIAFYTYLVYHDSGWSLSFGRFRKAAPPSADLEKDTTGFRADVFAEQERTETSSDELRLLNVRKDFGRITAVDNATFGASSGEILALLGPNGAGKTTTLGLIRGDIQPTGSSSEILISSVSVRHNRLMARRHLGVCPQFNTMDRVTVKEHLAFYARIRGVPDVDTNVSAVIGAVGLGQYQKRFTSKLSGGNQRKLSLATAIIGNPSVVLLDEPSSGMDALAMRNMWNAIRGVSADRAVVITTHSMEEADALAHKVVIMDRKLLAVGTSAELSARYGSGIYQVHIVHSNGPAATQAEMQSICVWMTEAYPRASVQGDSVSAMHGQIRFRVAIESDVSTQIQNHQPTTEKNYIGAGAENHLVGLLKVLEESKQRLGVDFYSISHMTLEDVFLDIVGRSKD